MKSVGEKELSSTLYVVGTILIRCDITNKDEWDEISERLISNVLLLKIA